MPVSMLLVMLCCVIVREGVAILPRGAGAKEKEKEKREAGIEWKFLLGFSRLSFVVAACCSQVAEGAREAHRFEWPGGVLRRRDRIIFFVLGLFSVAGDEAAGRTDAGTFFGVGWPNPHILQQTARPFGLLLGVRLGMANRSYLARPVVEVTFYTGAAMAVL